MNKVCVRMHKQPVYQVTENVLKCKSSVDLKMLLGKCKARSGLFIFRSNNKNQRSNLSICKQYI